MSVTATPLANHPVERHLGLMQMPSNILEVLTGPGAYKVCRLLRASEFAKFCAERTLDVDEERLRKLERLGLFQPLLRIWCDDEVIKVETVGEHRQRDLGRLEDGEDWQGDTRTQQLCFGFAPRIVESWKAHDVLWSPLDGPSAHDATIDSDPTRHEAHYSEFQIWDLLSLLQRLNISLRAENALDDRGQPNGHHTDLPTILVDLARGAINLSKSANLRASVGLFCQLISDRFYPQTQSDQRQMTVSFDSNFHGWDWNDHARTWVPEATRALFQLDRAGSERLHGQLCAEQAYHNPLHAWRGLARFVGLAHRKRLCGAALLAETLGEMGDMMRRFHKAAFNEALADPRETGFRNQAPLAEDFDNQPYRHLELAVNAFQLNPKPRLVLIVEGQTEEAVIPLIFERLFGVTADRYGIQIRGMRGVGNATGSKRDSMSALWRLVDFLHFQQTLALVLLDREGLAAKNIGKGLLEAHSIHFPERLVTRADYVQLWEKCFELDNFSDAEIAEAMSLLGGVPFVATDVAPARTASANSAKATGLGDIYQTKSRHGLDKIALGHALTEIMFAGTVAKAPADRPIGSFLIFAAGKAAYNHQPTTEEDWVRNQRSGYLGAIPGAPSGN